MHALAWLIVLVSFVVVGQNTDLSLSGFHIEFAQGPDGTWRIAGM